MKITMIGDSAVGKTTFMMSTYGLMRDGKIDGFRVMCKDPQADNRLVRAYKDFCTKGIYPPQTVTMNRYEYDFYSDDDWVINFKLTDIRGESIHDYDVEELAENLRESDTVMMFLNGYDIINGKDIQEQMDDILILLNNCFNVDDQAKLLMVVFTQMDRINRNLTNEDLNKLAQSVDELKNMADRNDKLIFTAVPTACSLDCMMDLDYSMITMMIFGYNTEVLKRKAEIDKEYDDIRKLYGEGFLRAAKEVLLEAFWIKDRERREARKRAEILQEQLPAYARMVDKMEKLKKFHAEYQLGTFYTIERRWSSSVDEGDPFAL